jgi:hypothetical protein
MSRRARRGGQQDESRMRCLHQAQSKANAAGQKGLDLCAARLLDALPDRAQECFSVTAIAHTW